jgi:hypothetical protein
VEQVSLQKLAVAQSVKKFSAITASTPAPKWIPPQAKEIKTTYSHPISLRTRLILSPHLPPGSQFYLFDTSNNVWRRVQTLGIYLCSFLPILLLLSLGSNNLLSTQFSGILILLLIFKGYEPKLKFIWSNK